MSKIDNHIEAIREGVAANAGADWFNRMLDTLVVLAEYQAAEEYGRGITDGLMRAYKRLNAVPYQPAE